MDEGDQNDVIEFKKPRKRGNIRKRDEADDSAADAGSEDVDNVVVSQPKRQKTGVTTASTKSSSISKEDVTNFAFASAGSETLSSKDDSIFGTLQTETERDRDAIAIAERNKILQEQSSEDGKELYRGMGGYKQYVPTKTAGPLRTTTHVRMSVRFDYQPDICKDYKETGYCGYGDNCKFLHDRGDYKAGWQIDKEYDEQQKLKKQGKNSEEDYFIPEEEELPFACFICRQPYTNPVVTKCGHYFCEDCALKRHEKDKRCFVCKEPTLGIFNSATKILKRMEEAKKRKDAEKAEEDAKAREQRALRAESEVVEEEHSRALEAQDEEDRPAVV